MTKTNTDHNKNLKDEAHQRAEFFGEAIFTYTRQQAIEDGVLVDVSEAAQQVGFKIPVALTDSVYSDCVKWDDIDNEIQCYQDKSGRLSDVLWMAYLGAKKEINTDTVHFKMLRIPRNGKSTFPSLVSLKMMVSGGDSGEPVLTIMQPNED